MRSPEGGFRFTQPASRKPAPLEPASSSIGVLIVYALSLQNRGIEFLYSFALMAGGLFNFSILAKSQLLRVPAS